MEDELKCPSCRQFYTQPVLLPCFHAMCLNCALQNQQPVVNNLPGHPTAQPHEQQQEQPLPPPPTELQLLSELQCNDCNDSDQLSILSETDSGVVVSTSGGSSGGSSRPSSCHIHHHPGSSSSSTTTTNNSNSNVVVVAATISLSCPSCRKIVYFDENGAQNLPRYRAMQTIVDKFTESSSNRSSTPCQLCPDTTTDGGQQQQQEAQITRDQLFKPESLSWFHHHHNNNNHHHSNQPTRTCFTTTTTTTATTTKSTITRGQLFKPENLSWFPRWGFLRQLPDFAAAKLRKRIFLRDRIPSCQRFRSTFSSCSSSSFSLLKTSFAPFVGVICRETFLYLKIRLQVL